MNVSIEQPEKSAWNQPVLQPLSARPKFTAPTKQPVVDLGDYSGAVFFDYTPTEEERQIVEAHLIQNTYPRK
jgi:hypothetical protein